MRGRARARGFGVPLSEGVPRATIVGFGATAKTVGVTRGRTRRGELRRAIGRRRRRGCRSEVREALAAGAALEGLFVAGVAVQRWTQPKDLAVASMSSEQTTHWAIGARVRERLPDGTAAGAGVVVYKVSAFGAFSRRRGVQIRLWVGRASAAHVAWLRASAVTSS